MAKLYERSEIYDLSFTPEANAVYREHYQKMLGDKPIRTVLDCSVGTGNLTLCLAELGYEVSGSDLSADMLKRCAHKARARGMEMPLKQCDFRQLDEAWQGSFDCVMSTGNSLAYVPEAEVRRTLRQMDARIRPGGWLYVDTRNWQRIVDTHQRFYFYNPTFYGDTRVDLFQVWDYNPDGTITFHLVFSFEREGKVFQREIFDEQYHPLMLETLLEELRAMGYEQPQIKPFPYRRERDFQDMEWYCLMARKP
ncbi:MAG: class I SAM-dependent methyltransferase [Eubacteriales bacterium]|nr:class I SAM-dependent methyltransferase [Eubacteriales bacterium]